MAPRSQGARHDAHGAGDRRIRNANTGAGVNSRRSTAPGGRGGSHERKGRRTQPRAPGRATMPRPQNGCASRPQGPVRPGNHDTSRSPQGQGLAARITTDTVNNETSTVSDDHPTAMLASPKVNSSPSQQPAPFSGSKLTRIFPESQRRLDPISPAGRSSSFTTSPNPIRMFNNAITRDSISSGQASPSPDFISGQASSSSPVKRPVYRGKDVIKRVVTNPKLRAIFADRPYPKQRRKSGEERPVLKMGISKEYK